MEQARDSRSRRRILQAVCCGAALGLSRLAGAQSMALPSADARKNAWVAAQKAVTDARGMADRITTTLDGLTSAAASAVALRDKLQVELRRLADEIAALTAARDRLLEEYRNGLFCSGCNKTKSEILAKGDQFPHPGQQIIRPTQAQIDAKERELQAPIDRAERAVTAGKKDFSEAGVKADNAFDQIRAGVALWRTAVTYWRGSVHKGLRERDGELKATFNEFQVALDAELQRQAGRRGRTTEAQVQGEADVWKRLLEKQKDEIDQFKAQSHSASVDLIERSNSQKSTINGYLQRAPLPKSLLAVVVVDAPVSTGLSAQELGVHYHLGRLAAPSGATSSVAWPPLPVVAGFVSDFKAAGLPVVAEMSGPGAGSVSQPPMATPSPQPVGRAPVSNSRLLGPLP